MNTMRQYAPYPHELADLVANLRYRPGWTFSLEDIERDPADTHGAAAGGLTLVGLTGKWVTEEVEPHGERRVYRGAMDAYHPSRPRPVYFYFPVPAATFNRASWQRWLFDRILDVERHEAMEYFQIRAHDAFGEWDERPYSPTHGPGDDPYVVHDFATDTQKRTSFQGALND